MYSNCNAEHMASTIVKEDLRMASSSSLSLSNASSWSSCERNEIGGACDGGDKMFHTDDSPNVDVDRTGKVDSNDVGACLGCFKELSSGPALSPTSCLDLCCSPNGR